MKVHELRTILDHLPDDLPVILRGGRGAVHVTEVRRQIASVIGSGEYRSKFSASLIIGTDGRQVRWYEDEPAFVLAGPFLRRDELLRKLDPDVPLGEAS